MSSLLVYKPANLFIIVSKYFFPIPLLKISSVTISADVFLYQPEFPWLNSSNIYLLTLLNADTFSFASHLSPAILHSGLNSFPLFQFRFIIFQVHKKSLIAFITHFIWFRHFPLVKFPMKKPIKLAKNLRIAYWRENTPIFWQHTLIKVMYITI